MERPRSARLVRALALLAIVAAAAGLMILMGPVYLRAYVTMGLAALAIWAAWRWQRREREENARAAADLERRRQVREQDEQARARDRASFDADPDVIEARRWRQEKGYGPEI